MRAVLAVFIALVLTFAAEAATPFIPPGPPAQGQNILPPSGVSAPIPYLLDQQNLPTRPPCLVGDSITAASNNFDQQVFTASGGTGPYTISVAGLPTGITAATTTTTVRFSNGVYTPGVYPITITVTDSASHTSHIVYNLTAPITQILSFAFVSNDGIPALAQTAYYWELSDRGPAFWVNFLSGGAIKIPKTNIFAHSGDTTTDVLARMAAIIAAAPTCGSYAVLIGTNDLSLSLQGIKDRIWNAASPQTSIVGQLLATGRPVYLQTLLARALSAGTSRSQLFALNDWIKSLNNTISGLRVVDAGTPYGDPLSPNGAPGTYIAKVIGQFGTSPYTFSATGLPACITLGSTTGIFTASACATASYTINLTVTDNVLATGSQSYLINVDQNRSSPVSIAATGSITGSIGNLQQLSFSYDELHPKTAGAYAAFKPLTDALMASVPVYNSATLNYLDYWDATNNPLGNIILFGGQAVYLAGTGSVSGRASGIAPDGWSLFSTDNGCSTCTYTAVGSEGQLSDGTLAEVITMGGTAAGGSETAVVFRFTTASLPTWTTGDTIVASCRIEVSGAQHISSPYLKLQYTTGAVTHFQYSGPVGGLTPSVSDEANHSSYSGVILTALSPPPLVGALSGSIFLDLEVPITNSSSGAIAGVIKVGGCAIRHG